jgi:hypothetical protein
MMSKYDKYVVSFAIKVPRKYHDDRNSAQRYVEFVKTLLRELDCICISWDWPPEEFSCKTQDDMNLITKRIEEYFKNDL